MSLGSIRAMTSGRRTFFGQVFGGLAVALGFKVAPTRIGSAIRLVTPTWAIKEMARSFESSLVLASLKRETLISSGLLSEFKEKA